MKRKLLTYLLASAMSVSLLTGTLTVMAEENKAVSVSDDPNFDKEEELVIGSTRDIAPGEQEAYYCIMSLSVWEPLISADNDGNILPCLATEWSNNDDFTEWIFHLRDDAVFHDGSKFNADAVLANLERHKAASGMSSIQYAYNFDTTYPNFDHAEKIDDYTVKLIFTESYPMLIENMVNYGSPMYSASNFNEDGSFNGVAIGTGAYKLVEHVQMNTFFLQGTRTIMVRKLT